MTNNFHDIIPPERRSIRNITTTHRHPRRPTRRIAEEGGEGGVPPANHSPVTPQIQNEDPSFFSRFGLWIVAGIAVIVFVLAFSLLFSGSTITITPKQQNVSIDGQFDSFRTAEVGQLAYELMSVERTSERTVPATGEGDVAERASGQIVVFNDFSTAEQRLITNTRFETPDGLIYRIDKPVVVPGQKKVAGQLTPGSVEVTVYADESGERHNIGLTDFTIPGFKGGPRFEGFFARSKTPMTGGFVGTRLTANESDIESARAELRTVLEDDLREQAGAEIPEGFHLFDGAAVIEFESLPQGSDNNLVVIQEKALLYGVVYRTDDIARFIATQTVAGYDQEPVEILNLSSLSFIFSNEDMLPLWEADSMSFSLEGAAGIIWLYDSGSLQNDLAGRSKDALPTILSGYPSIQEAQISLKPFWRRTFPTESEKITIERMLQ